MTVRDLKDRACERLHIHRLNAMQQTMAAQTPPVRLMLSAPTGAGKTLAYAISFLTSLPYGNDSTTGIIIAPTRELVLQIYETVRTLATPDFKTVVLYGGHSMQAEAASLSGKAAIAVATPGRLLDHIRRGTIDVATVRSLVLDEYDKALELGFHNEMRSILGHVRNASTLIFTSATSTAQLPDFIDGTGLKSFDFRGDEIPAPDLTAHRIYSPSADKLTTLWNLLRHMCGVRCIVFVNHREAAERVGAFLRKSGIRAGIYHGALDQDMRERALILFGNGTTPVLVATDLAARGLDINDVGSIIHYHMPVSAEVWTHRNGRAGRQGTDGQIFVVVSDADNVPDFVQWDDDAVPEIYSRGDLRQTVTLYINAGRKEKISRGDIAGYILRNSGLPAEMLGRIDVRDHCAYAAVPEAQASEIIESLRPYKLKNQRVRVSLVDTD